MVSDVNLVGVIDTLADHAAEEEDDIERKDTETKIMKRRLIRIQIMII